MYHHGNLREALLAAAEERLERQGLESISLRAIARDSGVSHAAPRNHFGSLAHLLSALAARGFRRLADRIRLARLEEGTDVRRALHGAGRAYVDFALEHPGLFSLMFRNERLDRSAGELRDASAALLDELRALSGAESWDLLSPRVARNMALAWAEVHGLAVLLLEGRLKPIIAKLEDRMSPSEFLEMILA
jgi:AcrR family transcriptional regulator